MDTKRSCALSPLINNYNPTVSTPRNTPPPKFSLGSNYALNFTPLDDLSISDRDEQRHLERHISDKTTGSFVTTYTSVQRILSQMQLKLATVFLQETEYLQSLEQQLEYGEQSLRKRLEQLKTIRKERKQLENEFNQVKDRLETAVIQVTKFHTDGMDILSTLFSESEHINQQFSEVLSECLASLNRSRAIIKSNIDDFNQTSNQVHCEFTDRHAHLHRNQCSITLLLELVKALNQFNVQHSEEITMTSIDFERQYQQFLDTTQTSKTDWNIQKQCEEVRALENEKRQLEEEFLEQTILLDNISTVLDKAMNR